MDHQGSTFLTQVKPLTEGNDQQIMMAQSGLGEQAPFEVLPRGSFEVLPKTSLIEESKFVGETAAGSSMMMFDDSKMQ